MKYVAQQDHDSGRPRGGATHELNRPMTRPKSQFFFIVKYILLSILYQQQRDVLIGFDGHPIVWMVGVRFHFIL
jgi:hypothetical protein